MPNYSAQYVALANITLGSTQAAITFSNIPAIYRDLVLVITGAGSGTDNLTLQFNSDTGTNYNRVSMNGNSITGAYSNSNFSVDRLYGAVGDNSSLNAQWSIMDYSATDKHKSILIRSNSFGGEQNVVASTGRWASTSAITSIKVYGTTYQVGSTFVLYGVR